MPSLRALVIANGDPPPADLLNALAAAADLVVAADGGAESVLGAGIRPHFIIGDLDSIDAATRALLGPEAIVEDPDPDHTDIEKAVAFCLERGASRTDIVGAGGGRADHALANLSVLVRFRGHDIRIVDGQFTIRIVDGEAAIDAPPGTVVSLIAIGTCTGVTTRGLRWELVEHTLAFSPYGVHNEVREPPASVCVASGDLLLFEGRWVEKHR